MIQNKFIKLVIFSFSLILISSIHCGDESITVQESGYSNLQGNWSFSMEERQQGFWLTTGNFVEKGSFTVSNQSSGSFSGSGILFWNSEIEWVFEISGTIDENNDIAMEIIFTNHDNGSECTWVFFDSSLNGNTITGFSTINCVLHGNAMFTAERCRQQRG